MLAWRNESKRISAYHIHRHADFKMIGRLFAIPIELLVVAKLDHPEVDLHVTRKYGQGKVRLLRAMKLQDLAKIQRGEQVPVHDEKGIRQVWNQRKRSGRSKGLVFPNILDVKPELRAVAADSLNQFAQIAGANGHVGQTTCRQ